MSDTRSPVVVPYADFIARREGRRREAAEPARPVDAAPIDPDGVPLAVAVAVRPISVEPG